MCHSIASKTIQIDFLNYSNRCVHNFINLLNDNEINKKIIKLGVLVNWLSSRHFIL